MQIEALREGVVVGFENGVLINMMIRSRIIESERRKHGNMPFPS